MPDFEPSVPNETLSAIMLRKSVRAYKSEALPLPLLHAVVEAGRVAPYVSADSRHFAVIQERATLARLNRDAKEQGAKVSEFHRTLFSNPEYDGTYGAPAAVILSGGENSLQYEAVCAAAAQNMLIAAFALGLGSCWAYFPIFAFHGDTAEAWRKTLRVPKGYVPCAAVLLGYAAEDAAESAKEEGAAQAPKRYLNEVAWI